MKSERMRREEVGGDLVGGLRGTTLWVYTSRILYWRRFYSIFQLAQRICRDGSILHIRCINILHGAFLFCSFLVHTTVYTIYYHSSCSPFYTSYTTMHSLLSILSKNKDRCHDSTPPIPYPPRPRRHPSPPGTRLCSCGCQARQHGPGLGRRCRRRRRLWL